MIVTYWLFNVDKNAKVWFWSANIPYEAGAPYRLSESIWIVPGTVSVNDD